MMDQVESPPILRFPEHLPIVARRGEIREAIARHPVVILSGETGSGKTTQLPKICLEMGRGTGGLIGVTQPRRIAVKSLSAFIARDLGSALGEAVGFKIRFQDRLSAKTRIKFMTDGILLAEIQGDPRLTAYDTLIIDEAHERSLNVDFILGHLHRILPRRPDLKVIISSATLDLEKFSRHFNDAPMIEVTGRNHPVEIRYRPRERSSREGEESSPEESVGRGAEAKRGGEEKEPVDLESAVITAVDELSREEITGDILVFLPGEREIREIAGLLRQHHPPATEILPLYARLSTAEQDRIFSPTGRRRIILATNVAETSITVPGIRHVVDSGLARISRFNGRSQIQRLPIEPISRSAADQRAGRCGRLGPGIAIRLFSEEDYLARPRFTDPEVRRTSLAAVILHLKAFGLGDAESFPFVDPPSPQSLREGMRLLRELTAIGADGEITPLGRKMARLPVDPRFARMLLASDRLEALTELLILVAALSTQDPRERPEEAREAAMTAHRQHRDKVSDFTSLLRLWGFVQQGRLSAGSKNKYRRLLKENFLSYSRVREWEEVHGQLHRLVKELGLKPNDRPASYEAIHAALLPGLLGQVGMKLERREFLGVRDTRFGLFPGSGLFRRPPAWVVCGELVETSRLFGRTAARVEPEWIETAASHLVGRHYLEPHWEKKSGRVMAFEKVTFQGLTLITRRKVHYGPIDPVEARKIFLQSALVEGETTLDAPFLRHNRALIEEIEGLEHKTRRRDILIDDNELFAFFDERVPESIHTQKGFDHWRRHVERRRPRILFLDRETLMRHDLSGFDPGGFPGHLTIGEREIRLTYHFEPGSREADGVDATIPLSELGEVTALAWIFEWLVPGLLEEKIIHLLKLLPKPLRRPLVPVPRSASELTHLLRAENDPPKHALCSALGRAIHRRLGLVIPIEAWRESELPNHLRMHFSVVEDHSGRVVAQGRDLAELHQRLGLQNRESLTRIVRAPFERENIKGWDFGPWQERLTLTEGGQVMFAYPALEDCGHAVALRLLDTAPAAREMTRKGMIRLFRLQLAQLEKGLERGIGIDDALCLMHLPLGDCRTLKRALTDLAVERTFLAGGELPTDAEAFAVRLGQERHKLLPEAAAISRLAREILQAFHELHKGLKGATLPSQKPVVTEIREQLSHLLVTDFWSRTPWEWLVHFPRYLTAARLRLERSALAPVRDRERQAQLTPHWRRWLERSGGSGRQGPELATYRWMIEEYRVSLFAQELKTVLPVSAPRLEKAWNQALLGTPD
ncbi:MAG: ATP-dependent RNA helicase HrpA [Magnetococcales bacterium]|nr:ATP-dependent RNA helicase HrpA [Magnetococcales bacterium]